MSNVEVWGTKQHHAVNSLHGLRNFGGGGAINLRWQIFVVFFIPSTIVFETEPHLSKIELADLEFMDTMGAGGFGQVWKGRWKPKNKIVAIKKVMELDKQEASPYGQVVRSVSKIGFSLMVKVELQISLWREEVASIVHAH